MERCRVLSQDSHGFKASLSNVMTMWHQPKHLVPLCLDFVICVSQQWCLLYRLVERVQIMCVKHMAHSRCYDLNVYVSPKFICWNPNPQRDGTGRWLSHESGANMGGSSGFIKETPLNSLASSTMWGHNNWYANPKTALTWPWSQTSNLQTCEKQISVYKPPVCGLSRLRQEAPMSGRCCWRVKFRLDCRSRGLTSCVTRNRLLPLWVPISASITRGWQLWGWEEKLVHVNMLCKLKSSKIQT